MSTIPGYTLEAYLAWEFNLVVQNQPEVNLSMGIASALGLVKDHRRVLRGDEFRGLVDLYEAKRVAVEHVLSSFDEDTQSWRGYAGSAFDHLFTERDYEVGRAYLDRPIPVPFPALPVETETDYTVLPWKTHPRTPNYYFNHLRKQTKFMGQRAELMRMALRMMQHLAHQRRVGIDQYLLSREQSIYVGRPWASGYTSLVTHGPAGVLEPEEERYIRLVRWHWYTPLGCLIDPGLYTVCSIHELERRFERAVRMAQGGVMTGAHAGLPALIVRGLVSDGVKLSGFAQSEDDRRAHRITVYLMDTRPSSTFSYVLKVSFGALALPAVQNDA